MHEMSLAEGILQLIEDAARRQAFSTVRTVWLEIGELAGVDPQALVFCFDAVVRGSVAQGARLDILHVPGAGRCLDCASTLPMTEAFGECPVCGSHRLQITEGTQMRVKELEVT